MVGDRYYVKITSNHQRMSCLKDDQSESTLVGSHSPKSLFSQEWLDSDEESKPELIVVAYSPELVY
jgi:hypothetical protein